jgi:hypothetical protein
LKNNPYDEGLKILQKKDGMTMGLWKNIVIKMCIAVLVVNIAVMTASAMSIDDGQDDIIYCIGTEEYIGEALDVSGSETVDEVNITLMGHFGGYIYASDISGDYLFIGQGQDFAAIPVMAVNACKRRLVYLLFRKHFMILRASTRHVTR